MEALNTIGYREQRFKNYSLSSIDNSKKIDQLYEDVKDLIDPAYKPFFMKRFQKVSPDFIRGKASEIREQQARGTARNTQSLFTNCVRMAAGF